MTSLRSRLVIGAAVIAILLVLDHLQEILSVSLFYRELYKSFPFYIPEGMKSILQIVAAVMLLALLVRVRIVQAMAEIGFLSPVLRGLAFGFGATLVMFLGFAATIPYKQPDDWFAVVYLAGLSPLAEEVVYRGFAVGSLERHVHAPRWLALLLPAVVFGLAHVEQGGSVQEKLALFALTGSGALFFGWFYLRWGRKLWMPFAIHSGMNLSWQLFDVGRNAIGGWWPFALQVGAVIAGIVLTVKYAPKGEKVEAHIA